MPSKCRVALSIDQLARSSVNVQAMQDKGNKSWLASGFVLPERIKERPF